MASKGEIVVNQISSGRWILTILAGISFLLFSMAVAYTIFKNKEFKPETIVAMFSTVLVVIQNVFNNYFYKPTKPENGENAGPK